MNCPPHIVQNFQVAPAADQSLCNYEGVLCIIVYVNEAVRVAGTAKADYVAKIRKCSGIISVLRCIYYNTGG